MFPLSFHLHIHSGTARLTSLPSVTTRSQTNERKRMRMSGRTLLQLIDRLLQRRVQTGTGGATFEHVKAHTDCTDIHSVGNRLADHMANQCAALLTATSRCRWRKCRFTSWSRICTSLTIA